MSIIDAVASLKAADKAYRAQKHANLTVSSESTEKGDHYAPSEPSSQTYGMRDVLRLKSQQHGSAVSTERISNLAVRLEGIDTSAMKDASTRFQESNFGSVHASSGNSGHIAEVENWSNGHSKNPIDNQPSDLRTSDGEMQSDEPAESESAWESFKTWAGSVVGSIFSGAGTHTPAGAVAGASAGTVAGGAFSILTANTGSVEEKKDEANGIFGIFRQGKTGTASAEAAAALKVLDGEQEPLPDDEGAQSHSPRLLDKSKFLGTRSEPVDDGGGETGGPIDTSASGTGKQGSLIQPADGYGDAPTLAVTRFDMISLRTRIEQNITVTNV